MHIWQCKTQELPGQTLEAGLHKLTLFAQFCCPPSAKPHQNISWPTPTKILDPLVEVMVCETQDAITSCGKNSNQKDPFAKLRSMRYKSLMLAPVFPPSTNINKRQQRQSVDWRFIFLILKGNFPCMNNSISNQT